MKVNQMVIPPKRIKASQEFPGLNMNGKGCYNHKDSNSSHTISKISNQSTVSIYLDHKHQLTKEKIEQMRYEKYKKMFAEVKSKPTISKNSKQIINRLFKIEPPKPCSNRNKKIKGRRLSILNPNSHSSNQIEYYKMIIESREQRTKAMRQQQKEKQREKLKRSRSAQLINKRNQLICVEEIKCQKDKAFNQEYTPYDEHKVLNVRDKLRNHYDKQVQNRTLQMYNNENISMNYYKQLKIEEQSFLQQTAKFGQQNDCNPNHKKSHHSHQSLHLLNSHTGRREIDIQLLTAFAEGLNANN